MFINSSAFIFMLARDFSSENGMRCSKRILVLRIGLGVVQGIFVCLFVRLYLKQLHAFQQMR